MKAVYKMTAKVFYIRILCFYKINFIPIPGIKYYCTRLFLTSKYSINVTVKWRITNRPEQCIMATFLSRQCGMHQDHLLPAVPPTLHTKWLALRSIGHSLFPASSKNCSPCDEYLNNAIPTTPVAMADLAKKQQWNLRWHRESDNWHLQQC